MRSAVSVSLPAGVGSAAFGCHAFVRSSTSIGAALAAEAVVASVVARASTANVSTMSCADVVALHA